MKRAALVQDFLTSAKVCSRFGQLKALAASIKNTAPTSGSSS
eukprot:CAMPEP_0194683520 /NCGR_PEP_ID=MMETSP0295-20121207/13485_1 /TAXON_ID=39354 /ORGANISM="Heterosigma akashiwo, Strain CCMP2393" /LENGTH=41 /DNA_ID= /DNA_START= /DNA_END= /DNA_ORIENTATION=